MFPLWTSQRDRFSVTKNGFYPLTKIFLSPIALNTLYICIKSATNSFKANSAETLPSQYTRLMLLIMLQTDFAYIYREFICFTMVSVCKQITISKRPTRNISWSKFNVRFAVESFSAGTRSNFVVILLCFP